MATATGPVGRFTSGEVVSAYLERVDTSLPASGTGIAASNGSVVITGLLDYRTYELLGGTSGNKARVVATPVSSTGSPSTVIAESLPRAVAGGNQAAPQTTGVLYLVGGLLVPSGVQVRSISF